MIEVEEQMDDEEEISNFLTSSEVLHFYDILKDKLIRGIDLTITLTYDARFTWFIYTVPSATKGTRTYLLKYQVTKKEAEEFCNKVQAMCTLYQLTGTKLNIENIAEHSIGITIRHRKADEYGKHNNT